MVSTRSSSRRKTHQIVDITDQVENERPRTCSEMVPIRFPALSSPLRSPLGNIKKIHTSSPILRGAKRDLRIPDSLHQTSSPIRNLEMVFENPVKDPLPNVSTGSHCWSGPSDSNHLPYTLDDLDMQLISQFTHQAVPQLASDQECPHIVPEKSTTSHVGRTSQCTSLNLTEFARRHQDDTDDDLNEVQSAIDPAFVLVDGHKVKKEYGPLLCAMFRKYDYITKDTEGKSPAIIAVFLERTCVIFKRLKETDFSQAKNKDLKEMLDEVRFLESQKMNLGWLRERLQYICETTMNLRYYLSVKEEGKRSETRIANLKNELAAEMAKSDQIKKRARNIRARVGDLQTHSLVHGLL